MTCCRPLFHIYPTQLSPQKAYVELDAAGNISTDYDGNVGSGLPADVWNGERRWFYFDATLTQHEIDKLVEEVTPKLKQLCKISEIRRNNQCNLCRSPLDGKEDEFAELLNEIEIICGETKTDDFEPCEDETCEYCTRI